MTTNDAEMTTTVAMILHGLAHLEAVSLSEQAQGADLRRLVPALEALVQTLQQHVRAQEQAIQTLQACMAPCEPPSWPESPGINERARSGRNSYTA
jgi:hypothetical protein